MLPHAITITPVASRDAYGKITYGTAVTYVNCRVVYKKTLVKGPASEPVLARGVVWLSATLTPDMADKVTLPDGTTPPLLMHETYPDDRGNVYTKLYFG